jgi:acetyl esterase/lipase
MGVRRSWWAVVFVLTSLVGAAAQLSDADKAITLVVRDHQVVPNITYLIANKTELKLDLYQPREPKGPTPVVMLIHGGGWVEGSKEGSVLEVFPYLQMGFSVVNVEYRLGRVSLAPAAVEDCLCALHWIGHNAAKYNFDLNKVVVTGGSAGGHLALTTGMIPDSAGLANECASDDDEGWKGPWTGSTPKVAAIINWFGITDVWGMLQGPNVRSYAVSWFGSQPGQEALAKRVSPLTYVRPGLPPILTIHGDADPLVPYSDAVRLHDALTKAGVRNQLLTIPGGRHGHFPPDDSLKAAETVRTFLNSLGITPVEK